MKDYRYQYIPLLIPQATPPNSIIEENTELDRSYNRITGIAVAVIEDAGLGNQLLVGARSNRKAWVDPVPVQLWNPDGIGPDQKYLTVDIPFGAKDTFFIQATPLQALVGVDAEIYMVLRLEADYTELPRK